MAEDKHLPIFICYAHEDNENNDPNKRWLNRLLQHLQPLVQQNKVCIWSDKSLETGEDWHHQIQENLQNARAAVLLISPAFLSSKYIRDSEVPTLLKNAQDNGAIIIPIILRPCLFSETPFKYPDAIKGPRQLHLSVFQSANPPDEPLNNVSEARQDEILVSVAQRLLKSFHSSKSVEIPRNLSNTNVTRVVQENIAESSLFQRKERENSSDMRYLVAKYWRPFLSSIVGLVIVWNSLMLLGFPIGELTSADVTKESRAVVVGICSLLFMLLRFPRIAIRYTRLVLGSSTLTPNLPALTLFKGPRPYGSQDRDKFPGRHKEADACWSFIQEQPFFILQGESGCGKSSLLNAAVIPFCREKFTVIECRMRNDPLRELYLSLKGQDYLYEKPIDEETLAKAIKNAKYAKTITSGSDQTPIKPLLLCIDQSERLFLSCVNQDVPRRVLFVLKQAILAGNFRLIIAIRSDGRLLLDEACREADSEQQAFNLGSFYVLRPFGKDQAEEVIKEILRPLHGEDPIIQQDVEDFSRALVRALLRPPRDRRKYRDDQKTVLPVELQIVGMTIESIGLKSFSASEIAKKHTVATLFSEYIEQEVKPFIQSQAPLGAAKAFDILKELAPSVQLKQALTADVIARNVGLPSELVATVLDALSAKYLVNEVPESGNVFGPVSSSKKYELMYEHLMEVLNEASDQHLKNRMSAIRSLEFWRARVTEKARDSSSKLQSFSRAIKSYFGIPIPLVECLRLWRFADSAEDRRMLLHNLLGFSTRLALLGVGGITVIGWTHTESYQIRKVYSEAPVAKVNDSKEDNIALLIKWAKALAVNGKAEEAKRILHEARLSAKGMTDADAVSKSHAIASVLEGLILTGNREEANQVVKQIEISAQRDSALEAMASTLSLIDETQDAIDESHKIQDDNVRSRTLVTIATPQAIKTNYEQRILGEARDLKILYYRSFALTLIAERLATERKIEQASRIVHDIEDEDEASKATILTAVAKAWIRDGKIKTSLDVVAKIKDEKRRSYALAAITPYLIKAGQATDEVLANTRNFSDKWSRFSVVIAVATAHANGGRVKEALDLIDREIVDESAKAKALSDVVKVLVTAGRTDDARAIAERIVPAQQGSALADVVEGLSTAGNTEEARKLALSISDEAARSQALMAVAKALATAGKVDKARDIASNFIDQARRARALADIAGELSTAGKTDDARTLALSITDEVARPQALVAVTLALAETGKANEARAVAYEIKKQNVRSKTLAAAARVLAGLGAYRQARMTADECSLPTDKLDAYAAILAEYAKRREDMSLEQERIIRSIT